MPTTSMLRAKGLATFSNYLSSIPEGSLFEALNVVIDRDGVIEPRRGIKVFGEIEGRSKQLLTFKNQILAHYDQSIAYANMADPSSFTPFRKKYTFTSTKVNTTTDVININQNGLLNGIELSFTSSGTLPAPLTASTPYFTANVTGNTFQVATDPLGVHLVDLTTQGSGDIAVTFNFIFQEVSPAFRIKYVEQNGNLYVTTASGIKKITQNSPLAVSDAGGVAALDLQLSIDLTSVTGFLQSPGEVAYRVVWGTKDINDNLILGAPSYRAIIQNTTGSFRNVFVSFAVPSQITTAYFYQIYRTSSAQINGSGDEMKLVYEAPFDGTSTQITILDSQSETLRDSGVPLYTNENTGEGILQANDVPPVSTDIAIYKNTTFYANTRTRQNLDLTLLGQDGLGDFTVTSISPTNPAVITIAALSMDLIVGQDVVVQGAGGFDGVVEILAISEVGADTLITVNKDGSLVSGSDAISLFTGSISITKGSTENTYYFVGRPEIYTVDVGNFAATSSVQTLTFSAVPTRGGFSLSYGIQATPTFDSSITDVDLQTGLRSLVGLERVTVSGTFATNFTITMVGVVAPSTFTISSNTLSRVVEEEQVISFDAVPDAGSYKLTYGSNLTSLLNFDANSAVIEDALQLLVGLSNVSVFGNYTSGFTVKMTGIQGPLAIGSASNTLTAAASPVVITDTVTIPYYGPLAAVDEQQTVHFSAPPSSGNFELVYGGTPTASLPYNATAGQIETALQLIPALSAVTVTGSPYTDFVVTFNGIVSPLTLTSNNLGLLTGATPVVISITVTRPYAPATNTNTSIVIAETVPYASYYGQYFLLNGINDELQFYVWLSDGSVTTDPDLANKVGIEFIFDAWEDTAAEVATSLAELLSTTGSFDASAVGTLVTIFTANSGPATNISAGTMDASWTFATIQSGYGEDASKNFVRLSSFASPALRIEDTAKSLVRVINQNENDVVTGYYSSDINELPGTMFFQSRLLDTVPFTFSSPTAAIGTMFNPDITTGQVSTNEVSPNKIFFSKKDQPEAVPLTNSLLVGPKDKAILRIIGLRDSLFILKEEGIYRLVGDDSTNFQVILFDNSANIISADTAAVLNNQIYCLTSQGVVTISETGVGIISRPIENVFNKVTSPSYPDYARLSFGVGYEADRAYLLYTVNQTTDTTATVVYRYNTFTQTWTSWDTPATCGVVDASKNKLYSGAADINAVEVERKNLNSRDYADRQYLRQISLADTGFIYMDSTNLMEKGDMLVQKQYVTPGQYNRIVVKAKQDPLLLLSQGFPEITTTGHDLRLLLEDLVEALNVSDQSLIQLNVPAIDFDTVTDTITFASHGLLDGDVVKFTGNNLPAPFVDDTYYAVISATTNTFQLSSSINGVALDITTQGIGVHQINELYYYSNQSEFVNIQDDFNYNVEKLNASDGVFFSDYLESIGTMDANLLIKKVYRGANKIEVYDQPLFFLGESVHYEAIRSNVVWAYMAFGEPSVSKQIREGVTLIESDALAGATVGYATDLSGNFENIEYSIYGDGGWGASDWSGNAWGGQGIAIPLRTLIPRQKQRCRYIKARFNHDNAFYKYAILGIAFTFNPVSERAYRL